MISRCVLAFSLTMLVGFTWVSPGQAEQVKKSSSGLCHPPESSWYERTKNFTGFRSLEECLHSGGRLPTGVTLASKDNHEFDDGGETYRRSAFGYGWDDSDGDCQDSRAEALIAQSSTKVRFADERRCRVVTGRWISPFTGRVIQNASEIDIDHLSAEVGLGSRS